MLPQKCQDVAPLLRGNRAILNDPPDQSIGLLAAALEQENHGQRHFAFTQIAADGLSEHDLIGRVVQQVVDELERHPQVEAVFAKRVFAFRA